MKKALTFITIFILCTHKVFAIENYDTPVQKICPAGLFCTANGKYTVMQNGKGKNAYAREDIQGYYKAPAELVVPGWGMWSEMRLCDECDKGDSSCAYCANHYDETWVSWFGFYTIKNGTPTYHSNKSFVDLVGIFSCPGTYPSSDEGSSSVFQCYRIVSNGKKEYYTAPNKNTLNYDGKYNTDDVNTMLTNLQSALEQAQTAARNLQNVLKKSNEKIKAYPLVTYNSPINPSLTTKIDTPLTIETNALPITENTKKTEVKTDTNTTTIDTTEEISVSTSLPSKQIKNITTSTTSSGFNWSKFDTTDLFSTSTNAKSALPVKSHTKTNTQTRTVPNNTKHDISRNITKKSRQAVTNPRTSRPTSGKNINRNVSNTVSRRSE